MITPNDIETKVFSSSIKGYKKEEVNQFLDEVMMDYQALLAENDRLKKENESMREEVAERRKSESAIMKTLEQAKSLMSDISASAEKRAEVIIRNAHTDAERIIQDAKDSVTNLTSQSETLKNRVNEFKSKYRKMLKEELAKVSDDEEGMEFFNDLKDDFFPASMMDTQETEPAEEEDSFMEVLEKEIPSDPVDAIADTPEESLEQQVFSDINDHRFDDKAKTIVIDNTNDLFGIK